jgi:hypothetical protein
VEKRIWRLIPGADWRCGVCTGYMSEQEFFELSYFVTSMESNRGDFWKEPGFVALLSWRTCNFMRYHDNHNEMMVFPYTSSGFHDYWRSRRG